MTQYTWLLFDADNTLFDYDRAEKTALQNTFVQAGIPFEPQYLPIYRQINGHIWRDFELGKITPERIKTKRFELLAEAVQAHYDAYTFGHNYLKNLANCTYLIDGAADLLQALYTHVDIALITNGLTSVQRPRFEHSAIFPYVKEVIISEEVGAAKPGREIFEIAFQRMGQPAKHEVLLVGDSLTSDMQGGKNYGIDTCWFNPQQKQADPAIPSTFEIQELRALLDILAVPIKHRP